MDTNWNFPYHNIQFWIRMKLYIHYSGSLRDRLVQPQRLNKDLVEDWYFKCQEQMPRKQTVLSNHRIGSHDIKCVHPTFETQKVFKSTLNKTQLCLFIGLFEITFYHILRNWPSQIISRRSLKDCSFFYRLKMLIILKNIVHQQAKPLKNFKCDSPACLFCPSLTLSAQKPIEMGGC